MSRFISVCATVGFFLWLFYEMAKCITVVWEGEMEHLKSNTDISDKERKLGVISKYERKDDSQPPKNCDSSQRSEPVMIEVWLYHPDILSRIGEYAYLHGHLHIVTEDGLEPVKVGHKFRF